MILTQEYLSTEDKYYLIYRYISLGLLLYKRKELIIRAKSLYRYECDIKHRTDNW